MRILVGYSCRFAAVLLLAAACAEEARHSAAVCELNRNIRTEAWNLYCLGQCGYLDVADAERALYLSLLDHVDVVAQHYISYVNLFRALGGGFEADTLAGRP